MQIEHLLPESSCWNCIPTDRVNGATGFALVKKYHAAGIQIRMIVYSEQYLADHWCDKGHVLIVQSGELLIEHKNKTERTLSAGSIYIVGDDSMSHRLHTTNGATVYIVD